MTLHINNKEVTKIVYNNKEVNEIYKGNSLLWSFATFEEIPIRFDYTGAVQEYIVPKGCKKLLIDCVGARGSGNRRSQEHAGPGGRVQCTLNVTSNQKLYLYVGEAGHNSVSKESFNGGGAGGNYNTAWEDVSNGGGASDIRIVKASDGSWYDTSHTTWKEDKSLLSRLVVAGGGGACFTRNKEAYGGAGGGLIAGAGRRADGAGAAYMGQGGTQTAGGANHTASSAPLPYKEYADFGRGCMGILANNLYWEQAGGGGWYGGGIGDTLEGFGGGGSSYTHPELCTDVIHTQGFNSSGHGYIIITPKRK